MRFINFGLSLLQWWIRFIPDHLTLFKVEICLIQNKTYYATYFRSFLWFFSIIQLCVFVGIFDSYHHLGSSCVSYTSANGIQNTSKASIRKFHRSQVYMIILFSSCLVNFNLFSHAFIPFYLFSITKKTKIRKQNRTVCLTLTTTAALALWYVENRT